MAVPLVIDTDGGIDDAVALWWALTDPRVEVRGIVVTWGNVELDVAAATCARVLAAAGRLDVPVALGAPGPVGPTPLDAGPAFVHGEDGLGNHGHRWPTGDHRPVAETGSELVARLTAEAPGAITVVTIGPLSSLARALADDPGIATRVAGLVLMGGTVRAPGNALPLAEANIAHDPVAAAAVLGAAWPTPPLLIGLDVTHAALLAPDQLELADRGHSAAARMLAGPLRFYADSYRRRHTAWDGAFPCHDLLAVVAAVDPTILTEVPTLSLAVDTGGSAAWGATVADVRPAPEGDVEGFHPCRVALGVDGERFRAEFARLVASPDLR